MARQASRMKFLSYNLRNGRIREEENTDIWNNWRYRREAALALIKQADPDVLALQEDSEEQLANLKEALKETHSAHCDPSFYDADKSYDAIFVRNTLAVADSGAFWIAGDGKRQAKIDGSICYRHATYVRLADADLLVVNVHLDHNDDRAAKRREIEVFIGLLSGLAGMPPARTIVMGDFNSTPDTEPPRILESYGLRDAARLKNDARPTSIHWKKQPASERIDYIWLSDDLTGKLAAYDVLEGRYSRRDGSAGHASDHSAVFAQVDL
jgi:endonuclease/exonuclease/phosphatase family metal-dependent hydrolase